MTQLQLLTPESQQPSLQRKLSGAPLGLQGGRGLANLGLQTQYSVRGVSYGKVTRSTGSKRRIELEWRRNNTAALRPYVGQWVVLERDQIIASGASLGQAVSQARANGVLRPYVFRVEHRDEDVATFGI